MKDTPHTKHDIIQRKTQVKSESLYHLCLQHAQPSRSFSIWMLMGSWKSPLNSSDSSWSSAFRAMTAYS
jgi:hypothetical protein